MTYVASNGNLHTPDMVLNGNSGPNRPSGSYSNAVSLSGTSTSSALTAVAIVGMACRLPGNCSSPDDLWDLLKEQRSPQSKIPSNRFNIDAFYHPKHSRPGSMDADGGYFISEDVREFDPTFFGISGNEAVTMDPQQRKILEVAYEALESAGVPLNKISGSRTGCFCANFTADFGTMQYRDPDFGTAQNYLLTGTGIAIMSNRVSYVFNLQGPSLTLDTACSSSVYALHLACQSIADGSCDGALVIGTNLMLTVEQYMASAKLGVLSPTSRCHTFDVSADGYARAEGVSALYIKGIRSAIEDRDPIRAVIRATSFNSNGKSPGGLTNPSPAGQEAVIRDAYRRAGDLELSRTGYFECHGTGTYVGDPLEVAAIGSVFAEGRNEESPLLMGSVKTNLGHSEAASGITSIIKCVLALERAKIPATVGLKEPNPNIDFKEGRLRVVTEETVWPSKLADNRIASINSFGYGGANGHVILQDTKSALKHLDIPSRLYSGTKLETTNEHHQVHRREQFLHIFSAHDEATLKNNIQQIDKYLEKNSESNQDLAYTLGVRRSHFYCRSYRISSSRDDIDNPVPSNLLPVGKKLGRPPQIAFAFTGQGAQWAGMGAELLTNFPTTLKTIRYLDTILQGLDPGSRPSWTLEDALLEPPSISRINDVDRSQPLCTAVQLALIGLFRLWDIVPVATIGHSSGEIAAAYSAGLITMDDAIKIAYYRGLHVSRDTAQGSMLAVGTGPEDISKYDITGSLDNGRICVACINSPTSITVSGDSSDIEELASQLSKAGIFNRVLRTGGKAYHSHHMRAVGSSYESSMQLDLQSAGSGSMRNATMYSSVTSKVVKTGALGPSYWRQNLESPVQFSSALKNLLSNSDLSVDHILEIGPHAALAGPIRDIREKQSMKIGYTSALYRGQNSSRNVLTLAGDLFVLGYPVNIERVNSVEMPDGSLIAGNTLQDLTPYQWNYTKQYWNESSWHKDYQFHSHARHDILGRRIPGADHGNPTWRNILRLKDVPWLADHKAGGAVVLPATGYVAMVAEAVHQLFEDQHGFSSRPVGFRIKNFSIQNPIVIPEGETGEEVFTNLRPAAISNTKVSSSWYEFTIGTCSRDKGLKHCTGKVRVLEASSAQEQLSLPVDTLIKCGSPERWYSRFESLGLEYGPAFRTLGDIKVNSKFQKSTATVPWKPSTNIDEYESRYFVHPATLDVCVHSVFIPAFHGKVDDMDKVYLPVSIEEITIQVGTVQSIPDTLLISNTARLSGFKSLLADTYAMSPDGRVMVSIKGLRCSALNHKSVENALSGLENRTPFLRMLWKPDITMISASQADKLFPGRQKKNLKQLFDDMNTLCILCLYNTVARVEEATLADEWHLKHYFSWMKDRVAEVEADQSPLSARVKMIPIDRRHAEIEHLFHVLRDEFYESRLLQNIFRSYPLVLSGKMSGIEPLLEEDLLNHVYVEGLRSRAAYDQLARALDCIGHKNPDLRILEVGAGTGGASGPSLIALEGSTIFKKYEEYVYTDVTPAFLASAKIKFSAYRGMSFNTLDIEKDPLLQGYTAQSFDVIISANCFHATKNLDTTLNHARKLLKPGGHLVVLELTKDVYGATMIWGSLESYWHGAQTDGRTYNPFLSKEAWLAAFERNGFNPNAIALDDYEASPEPTTVFVATASSSDGFGLSTPVPAKVQGHTLGLLHRSEPAHLSESFALIAQQHGLKPVQLSLAEYHSLEEKPENIISLVDLEGSSLLLTMNGEEYTAIQDLVRYTNKLIWLCPGGIQCSDKPEYGVVCGWARTIAFENPLAEFITMDIDPENTTDRDLVYKILQIFSQTFQDRRAPDREFGIMDGVTYVPRMVGDEQMNERFVNERRIATITNETKFDSEKATMLDLEQPGLLDTFYFRDDPVHSQELQADEVEIKVESAGLVFKGVMVAMGQFDDDAMSWECAGTVHRVGSEVKTLKPGDHVVSLCIARFNRFARVKETLAHSIPATESFEEMATLPIAYVTGIHALYELANLRKGEKVLIQSATGGTGLACVQLAQAVGAEIFATVGSDSKRKFLEEKYQIPSDHIFGSRDSQFVEDVLAATTGRGVDVILASTSGELLFETFRCLGHLGRLVEIGRSDVYDHASLDLNSLKDNINLYSFDLSLTIAEHPESCAFIQRHLKTMLKLYNEGKIAPIKPIQSFHITDISSAIRTFSQRNQSGKIVLNYGTTDTPKTIKAKLNPQRVALNQEGSYLMIGCLSGLGLSISKFMVERGARSLIFLSRSGDAKPEAATLVDELRTRGVHVAVIRGDASVKKDVQAAVTNAQFPVKGVVQSAMVLRDSLFNNMSLASFQAAITPKVQGTLNLHETLLETGQNVDFFLMLSSVAAYIGHTAQSNYAAGNSYQDSLARHRHQLGLPATSLALGIVEEVGYVSERTEVAAGLARHGMTSSSEDDFLELVEHAMLAQPEKHFPFPLYQDSAAESYLITGMEPAKITTDGAWMRSRLGFDPRSWIWLSAIKELRQGPNDAQLSSQSEDPLQKIKALLLADDPEATPLLLQAIKHQLSVLLLLEQDQVDEDRAISDYGLDSMVGAELRNWVMGRFGVQVGFLELVEPGCTIKEFGKRISQRMKAKA